MALTEHVAYVAVEDGVVAVLSDFAAPAPSDEAGAALLFVVELLEEESLSPADPLR